MSNFTNEIADVPDIRCIHFLPLWLKVKERELVTIASRYPLHQFIVFYKSGNNYWTVPISYYCFRSGLSVATQERKKQDTAGDGRATSEFATSDLKKAGPEKEFRSRFKN